MRFVGHLWRDLEPLGAWAALANCADVDTDLFFPTRGERAAEAKAVCAGCQVRAQCLEAALRNNETHGIWGGASERERRRLRRARRMGNAA